MLLPISDSLLVQADADLRLLRFQWAATSSQPVRPALVRFLELVVAHQPRHLVVDFTGLPPIGFADEIWLARRLMPVIVAQSLELVALVFPARIRLHNQLAIEALLWASRRTVRFQFQIFDDTSAAIDWLTSSPAAVQQLQAEWAQAAPAGRF